MHNVQDNLLGEANTFLEVLEQVSRLAPLNKPVLIIGERGTGKELIAHRLHYLSSRWQGPFISLNCAALNENLLDSELFGHEAGAFTGARNRHQGRFERADGGTLFLDELATAPMSVQEKLLRVIEYGQLERVGGTQLLQPDVRLVCATNADLPALAAAGTFRADLLDRLAFDVVLLPALRDRPSDILLLADHFARQMCRELGLSMFEGFTPQAQRTLQHYAWPGNVRELKNVVERAVYRHGAQPGALDKIILNPFQPASHAIATDHSNANAMHDLAQTIEHTTVAASVQATPLLSTGLPLDLKAYLAQQEKQLIHQALHQARFNQRRAAELLGITYHQLRGLLKKYAIGESENETEE